MTALSKLELELFTSGTKKNIQTNREGDRVPKMTWLSSSPASSSPTIEHISMVARLAGEVPRRTIAKPIVTHKDDSWDIDRPRSHTTRRPGLRCL